MYTEFRIQEMMLNDGIWYDDLDFPAYKTIEDAKLSLCEYYERNPDHYEIYDHRIIERIERVVAE